MRVFADNLVHYAQAGWPCILPVPAIDKHPPPVGFTGANGRDTDPVQLVRWAQTHADHSIALRMPDGVIGIDVDHYDKGKVAKRGADTLAELVERWGPLPPTWSSTARGDDSGPGPSRIMFFRVPAQRYATKLGPDIEIIQRHHRYAVVAPSAHPQTGGVYRWYGPDGGPADGVPRPDDFAELPERWVQGLHEGATDAGPAAADVASGQTLLDKLLADNRLECVEIANARQLARIELEKADAGSRHDTMTARVHRVIQLAAEGHTGVALALDELRDRWAVLTTGEDRADEFDRMLLTSARKAVTVVGIEPVPYDPCVQVGAGQVSAPAPGDDRPDVDDKPEPIGPIGQPVSWGPRHVVGTHPFDPQAELDQPLAQAVLTRMYPYARYAYDARTWIVRRPEIWETLGDQPAQLVSHAADLMLLGDPEADKESEDYKRHKRRARFSDHATANKIAGKMRAVVLDGTHPSAIRLGDLDREPDVLWAGGLPWDLRASTDGPAMATRIDPSTPHLHSAAVAPDVRPTPLWDAFVAAVWPDPKLRAWALRVLSIAFTGYPDRALPILLGETGRGKTQIVTLLMSVLGTYAHSADPRLLGGADNTHASIVYALKGRRLSFIDEGPREGRWAQERLKQLTGGAELTGNRMRENPITFFPTHTLILTANDEPVLTDPAVRSRVRLIPCEGDPDAVAATRAAIGDLRGAAWRAEAPGVLAGMMREAARWLADRDSASTAAAPEAVRFRAEQIAAEQDPIRNWVESETEPNEAGTPSRQLYEQFVQWARNGNTPPSRIPSETRWGRELSKLGYPSVHSRDGKRRQLRIRGARAWDPILPTGSRDGFVTGRDGFVPQPVTDETAGQPADSESRDGCDGFTPITSAYTRAHTRTHKRETRVNPKPVTDKPKTRSDQGKHENANPSQGARTRHKDRTAAEKRAEARQAAIAEAAGERVELPAVLAPGGTPRSIELDQAATLVLGLPALTVDVEHTGFPVGHRNYALRTVQLGTDAFAVVLDPAQHRDLIRKAIATAPKLHAHSATADLVPLVWEGLADLDAWERMHDTVIPAKLADPASTGADPDLKRLAAAVLGDRATSLEADKARAALFKAGKWLTETKVTTPLERSGWAQVDHRCSTMVRYDASDVLDTAALAKALPAVPPQVYERERTAQRMTARIAHRGLAINGEHVERLLAEHTAARQAAAEKVAAFGVENPGSGKQVAEKLVQLGADLPRTDKGNVSVAEGVLAPLRTSAGPVGELVSAVLDYREHDTAIGTFLEPYKQLVDHGDGRARPTVYTLAADTGRMSCVRPNMQQVPREGGFRACFTADPGQLLISADFSGVELRVAAALSGDRNLRRMIENGIDLHWEIARQVFGPEATKSDRYMVKRGVFGRIYGGSVPTLAKQVGCPEPVMAAAVATLDAMLPELAEWSRLVREAVKAGRTQFPTHSGRVVHLPEAYPHKGPNYCIQGTARELLVDALVRWQRTRWGEAVILPVHDEIVAAVPEDEAEEATKALVDVMESEINGVRIAAEASEPSFEWRDAA